MSPRMFSFNNPFGACQKCDGLGVFKEIDEELIIPDKKLSINQGAIKASGWNVSEAAQSQECIWTLSLRNITFLSICRLK